MATFYSSFKNSSLVTVSSLSYITPNLPKSESHSSVHLTSKFTKSSTPKLLVKQNSYSNSAGILKRIQPESILITPENNMLQSFDDTTNIEFSSISEIVSEIEKLIEKAKSPFEQDNLNQEIEINDDSILWTNKLQSSNWKGTSPLSKYKINKDTNPLILNKKSDQKIEYIQNVAIRYLKPTTPPPPSEIIINQLRDEIALPAPPIILRQQPARPFTPEPLVIREKPPNPPVKVGRKVISISGKKLPPPPRKVVIERLAPLPTKPQSVILERWLPYSLPKRKVIYNKTAESDSILVKPRNVIVQWELPEIQIRKEFKYLGVIRANPSEYVQRFKNTIVDSKNLPKIVSEIPNPIGLTLAADYNQKRYHELEGDLDALRLIDLEREGLSVYKNLINNITDYHDKSIPNTAIRNSAFIKRYANMNFLNSPNSSYIKNINEVDSKTAKLISSCNKSPISSSYTIDTTSSSDPKKHTYSIYDIRNSLQEEEEKNEKIYFNDDRKSQPLTTSHYTDANISQSVSSNDNISSSNNQTIHKLYSTSYNNHNNSMINFYRQTNPTKILSPNKKIRSCIPRLTQSCRVVSKSIDSQRDGFSNPKKQPISSLESRAPSVLETSSIINNELNLSNNKSMNLN